MAPPRAARAPLDDTVTPRVLLVALAVVIPLAGLLTWSAPFYNPMGPRLAFGLLAGGALAASFGLPAVRDRLMPIAWLLSTGAVTWFQYVAYRNQLLLDDLMGILILAVGATAALTHRAQLVGNVVLGNAAFLAIGALEETQFPVSTSVVLYTSAVLGIGLSTLSRQALQRRLVDVNATLEERVAQRTARLHHSMALLSEEMDERARAEQAANAANQAKSTFLATMSHELRTPLNAVLGYAELIGEDLEDQGHTDSLEDLGRLGDAARQLLRLIDQVLDLTRVEQGDFQPTLQPVDLGPLAETCVDDVRAGARHGNQFRCDLEDELLVHADPDWLARVLRNLLSNAEKFTRQGTIELRAVALEHEVHLFVADTGQGMPEGAAQHIFDRFTQVDGSRTRRHDGAGLGLAVTRELLERMGGWIDVESRMGQGSTFRVGLPRFGHAPASGTEIAPCTERLSTRTQTPLR